jgi:hypothetical protein
MKIEITEGEIGLCIGALEFGVKSLREGKEASDRMKMPMPDGVMELVDQMAELRTKLMKICGLATR